MSELFESKKDAKESERDALMGKDGFSLEHGRQKGEYSTDDWYDRKTGFVRHSCTDVVCAVVFGIMLLILIGISCYAVAEGDYRRLYHGSNYLKQTCGIDIPDQESVYFCQTYAGSNVLDFQNPICVPDCPSSTQVLMDCKGANQVSYVTHSISGNYCIPKDQALLKQVTGEIMKKGVIYKFLTDAYLAILDTWPIMIVTAYACLLMGYMYLFLLRNFAQSIILIGTIFAISGFGLLGLYLFVASFVGGLDGLMNTGDGWDDRIIGLVSMLLAIILTVVACMARKYEKKTIQTMRVSCECLFQCPALLLEPLISTCLRFLIGGLLLMGLLLLLSTGTIEKNGMSHSFTFSFLQTVAIIFYVFMMFWIVEMLYGLSVWVVSHVVEHWFFQPTDERGMKEALPCCELCNGYKDCLVYHIGSLALGSVILMFTRPLRLAWYFCIQVCRCTGQCARKYWASVGTFNKDAYMDQALYSNNFLPSAHHGAYSMDEQNVAALAGSCWLVELMGLAMMFLTGGVLMLFQVKMTLPLSSPDSNYYLSDPAVPAVVTAFLALAVGTPFMLTFGLVADTMLFCYGTETEMTKLKVLEGVSGVEGYLEQFEEDVTSCLHRGGKKSREVAGGGGASAAPEWLRGWISDPENHLPSKGRNHLC